MTDYTLKNAIRNLNGSIDCEWEHPELGWIPFTASELDSETHGQEIFKQLDALDLPIRPAIPEIVTPAMVDQERRRRIDEGFVFNDVRYSCSDAHLLKIQGIVTLLDEGNTDLLAYEPSPGQLIQFKAGEEYNLNQFFGANKVFRRMHNHISKMTLFANRLKTHSDTLPLDYTNDRYWTEAYWNAVEAAAKEEAE